MAARNNILLLSSWFPYPPDNGARQRAYYLLQGLAAKHPVTMVALKDADQSSETATPVHAMCRRVITFPRRQFAPRGLRARAALFSPQPRSLADTFDPLAQRTIQETAREKFGAIVAFQLSMAVYAQRLAHPAKVFDEVEAGLFADAFYNARGLARLRAGLTWFKYARFLNRLAGNFAALTIVSATEQSLLTRIGLDPHKLHILPNGVDCAASVNCRAPINPFTLIYNGALTYHANYDAMRYFTNEILPQIQAAEPRAQLKITGRAPQFAINEISKDNAVSFTGYVDDIRAVVQSSAVCIVPLREGGGTRLKILEAMALGTPVVSTTKGAEGLDVRDGEHLLLADTPEAFAHATVRLLRDPVLRESLTSAARERVCTEYDWNVIQKRMDQVIERVLSLQ